MIRKDYRIIVKIMPAIFLLFLAFPFVNSYLHLIDEMDTTENRKKAKEPNFDITDLDPYPLQYNAYIEDNISLRNHYIFLHNCYNYFLLKKSINEEKVTIGKDGWLFRINQALPVNAVKDSFNIDELLDFRKEIKRRTDYYKKNGADFYIFIVPNKATVYPEFVSSRYQSESIDNTNNKIDKLMNFLSLDDSIRNVFYLKDELVKTKDKHRLYYKKDHHWNNMAGFYATGFINAQLNKKYPQISDLVKFENYNISYEKKHYGNLSQLLGIKSILNDEIVYFTIKDSTQLYQKGKIRKIKAPKGFAYSWAYQKSTVTKNKKLPKGLIIRDSFSKPLIPFLAYSFSEVLYIWDAWRYGVNEDIFMKEKPDIVIDIIVEENLYKLIRAKK